MAPTEPATEFLAYHCQGCDSVHHAYSSELDYSIRWMQCLDPECLQEFADSLGDECPNCLGDGGYGHKHPTTDHRVVVCPDCQENALVGLIPNWELELIQLRHASLIAGIRSELVRIQGMLRINRDNERHVTSMDRVIDQLGPEEEPIVITTRLSLIDPSKEPKALIYQNKSGLRD